MSEVNAQQEIRAGVYGRGNAKDGLSM